MAFIINNIAIKTPSTFKIERYNVTNMVRLANAEMSGELIAKKRKFYFTYNAISARELNKILDALWNTDVLFVPFECDYNSQRISAIVYVGSIPTTLHRDGPNLDSWVWKNVTFNLIEK